MKNNKISFFKDKDDLYVNFDKNNDKIILITGISGSGKSTLAKELLKQNNCIKFNLDLSFFHGRFDFITEEENKIIKEFKKEHPEWTPKLFEGNLPANHQLFFKYSNLFFDFVINYFNIKDKILIIEGSHIFKYINFDKVKNKKIIIKRTSFITCCYRRIKRTIGYANKRIKNQEININRYIKIILIDIKQIFTKRIKWYIQINEFIKKITS